jgi:hypothetical protein
VSEEQPKGAGNKIVLAPRRYFPADELQPLVDGIRELGFEVEVLEWENPFVKGRYGVTWYEVIHVHLPQAIEAAAGGAAGALLKDAARDLAKDGLKAVARRIGDVFVDWAKKRRQQAGRNPKQPKMMPIYGPDGKTVVLQVTIKEGDPEIKEH